MPDIRIEEIIFVANIPVPVLSGARTHPDPRVPEPGGTIPDDEPDKQQQGDNSLRPAGERH